MHRARVSERDAYLIINSFNYFIKDLQIHIKDLQIHRFASSTNRSCPQIVYVSMRDYAILKGYKNTNNNKLLLFFGQL